jgi:hypothetical protein
MLQKLSFLYRFLSKLLCELLPAAVASCKMRTVTVAIAIALLTVAVPAHAKGKRQQQDAPKAEDQAKKKAAEEAYENALKGIPTSNEKSDPWKTMR